MQRLVLAVVLVAGLVGCRKAGIAIGGAVTAAAATGGTALVATSDRESDRRATGVVLISYAIVAMSVTAAIIASGDTSTSDARWASTSSAGDETATSTTPASTSTSRAGDETATPPTSSEPRLPARDSYRFDRSGALDGRRDPNGYFYDKTGALAGRVDSNGTYYDKTGASAGRADANGSYYDRSGATAGRIDSNGYFYDRTGASAGRIDSNGYIYDATGAMAGRVDTSCDDACRRETIGRILIER